MRAIAVDDDKLSLEILTVQLENIQVFDEVISFDNSNDALEWLKTNDVDAAFLDIIMDDMNGIELARNIRNLKKPCHIIFVSSSTDYAMEAYRVHADAYMTKPINKEAVLEELKYIPGLKKESKPLRIKCFGNFEAFDQNNTPLKFKYKKTKEMLAYLIMRNGSTCNLKEIAAVLYEDKNDSPSLQSQMRNLVSDLNKSLKSIDASDALYREKADIAIVPEYIECDYYKFNDGVNQAIKQYKGEFMSQYDWAELTSVYLDRCVKETGK